MAKDKSPEMGAPMAEAPKADPMAEELAALKAELEAAKTRLAERAVIQAAPLTSFRARCRILMGGAEVQAGARLPFDPTNPPEGCDGLQEGVHWERARAD